MGKWKDRTRDGHAYTLVTEGFEGSRPIIIVVEDEVGKAALMLTAEGRRGNSENAYDLLPVDEADEAIAVKDARIAELEALSDELEDRIDELERKIENWLAENVGLSDEIDRLRNPTAEMIARGFAAWIAACEIPFSIPFREFLIAANAPEVSE